MLGLTWCRSSEGHKSKAFLCPSWSWASQKSEVSYRFAAQVLKDSDHRRWTRESGNNDYYNGDLAGPMSHIANVDWKADVVDLFGNVLAEYIDLYTRLGLGTVMRDYFLDVVRDSERWKESQATMIHYITQSGKAHWYHAKATMDNSEVAGARVTIALLQEPDTDRRIFLLLDPPDLDAGTFRCVGLAELDNSDYFEEEDKERREVTREWIEKTIRLL